MRVKREMSKPRTTKKELAVLVVLGCVSLPLAIGFVVGGQDQSPRRESFDRMRSRDTAIVFYGLVRDQHDAPVPGTEVHIDVQHSDSAVGLKSTAVVVMSDRQGRFQLDGIEGQAIHIKDMQKTGYAYDAADNRRVVRYSLNRAGDSFKADPKSPIAFRIRKKDAAPALLIPGSFTKSFRLGAAPWTIDLLALERESIGTGQRRDDIRVTVWRLTEESRYEVVFSAIGEEDGLMEHSDILYTAPADGYRSTVTMTVGPESREQNRYLYARCRGEDLNSRLTVTFTPTPEWLRITVETRTNPAGSTNLEYDEEMFLDHVQRRYDELRANP